MQYHEFVEEVQNRARLASVEQGVNAIRATLETLAERLTMDESSHLAAQLPEEIAAFLAQAVDGPERFSLDEFFQRVAGREGVNPADATAHARVVFEVLGEAISRGEIEDMSAQLPEEFRPLIETRNRDPLRRK